MNTTIYNKTHITVLTGQKPSIKNYIIEDGKPKKGTVKTSYLFEYVTHDINNIDELYDIINQTSNNDNGVIIRGRTKYKQDWDVRRLLKDHKDSDVGTFFDEPTAWGCIDFDEQSTPDHIDRLSQDAIEWLIKNKLPKEFHNSSYIYQWSSSAGLEYNNTPIKNGTNVHLFFYLDKGLTNPEFDGWFVDVDDKTIDKSVFRTVQPIFVNANVNKDNRIVDLIPLKNKIGIVYKDNNLVVTPADGVLARFKQLSSTTKAIDVDSANIIIQKLQEVGCITNNSGRTLSLKSPREKTQGGYYTKTTKPTWINHGGQPGRRVDQWLREEWGVEFEMPTEIPVDEEDFISLVDKFKNKFKKTTDAGTTEDAFEISEPSFVDCYPRAKRQELTKKAYKTWKTSQIDKMMLYAFEGFGKSRVVHILVEDKQKVLVGSKTNEQAEEHYKKFTEQGLRVQLILSRKYQLKQLGYGDCVVEDTKTHPWDAVTVNKSETLRNIKESTMPEMTKEQVEEIWEQTAVDKVDWFNHDVVVMTHTRLALTGQFQEQKRLGRTHHGITFDDVSTIPQHVVCIWDDVDRTDFAWLAPYDAQYANVEIDGKLIETQTFKKIAKNKQEYDVHYFVKPESFRYGYGLRNRQIFSTTEQITTFLIERYVGQDNIFVPELMPEIKMKAGDITIFKTQMTGRNKDGMLLPLLNRVKKEGYDFYTIGDSISTINHTNNKGQNCFDDKDIVVEVSQMNMLDIPMWLDELGWADTDIQKLKVVDALDRLHQAIGRNSGYRWADKPDDAKKCVVVLMDAFLMKAVIKQSRYYIDAFEDLDNPNYATYRKREKNCLADCIAWYIQNLDAYITSSNISKGDRKLFERDCLFVKENYDEKFVNRMKIAMEHIVTNTKNAKTKATVTAVLKKL
jgi:hypothetical protein